MSFGQLIIGPPGSGKTTYTHAMQQLCLALKRPYLCINLDPANDSEGSSISNSSEGTCINYTNSSDSSSYITKTSGLPYDNKNTIDIKELIRVEDVMDEYGLGPNGGLVYCMEFLEENIDWLVDKFKESDRIARERIMKRHENQNSNGMHSISDEENNANQNLSIEDQLHEIPYSQRYLLFDCPGQVELYVHSDVLVRIIRKLEKALDLRLTCVHLLDSSLCADPASYLSGVLTALTATVHLELPHINVLSKIDLMKDFRKELDFRLEYYLGVEDLSHLLNVMQWRGTSAKNFLKGRRAREKMLECGVNQGKNEIKDDSNIIMDKFNDPESDDSDFDDIDAINPTTAKDDEDDSDVNIPFPVHPLLRKFRRFNFELADLIEEFGLVRFDPLDVRDCESVLRILMHADQANGRVFAEKCMEQMEKEQHKSGSNLTNSSGPGAELEEEALRNRNKLFDLVLQDNRSTYDDFIDRIQEKMDVEDLNDDEKLNPRNELQSSSGYNSSKRVEEISGPSENDINKKIRNDLLPIDTKTFFGRGSMKRNN